MLGISSVIAIDWAHYASPDVLIPTAVVTGTILVSTRLYRLYLRRISGATKISTSFWRKRSIFGHVTSVGDGDGLRLFHTPGGRLAGWGWLRSIPKGKALKDKTVGKALRECRKAVANRRAVQLQVSIRLAGVDAPEGSHFGRPAQPGAQEALDWLTSYVLKRRVRAYLYKKGPL